jgi:hypothetical protein
LQVFLQHDSQTSHVILHVTLLIPDQLHLGIALLAYHFGGFVLQLSLSLHPLADHLDVSLEQVGELFLNGGEEELVSEVLVDELP